eukprot:CFRG3965T1
MRFPKVNGLIRKVFAGPELGVQKNQHDQEQIQLETGDGIQTSSLISVRSFRMKEKSAVGTTSSALDVVSVSSIHATTLKTPEEILSAPIRFADSEGSTIINGNRISAAKNETGRSCASDLRQCVPVPSLSPWKEAAQVMNTGSCPDLRALNGSESSRYSKLRYSVKSIVSDVSPSLRSCFQTIKSHPSVTMGGKKVRFSKKATKSSTFSLRSYDRTCAPRPQLSPTEKMYLYIELMTYKLTEMLVHRDAIQYTNKHLSRLDEESLSIMTRIINEIINNNLGSISGQVEYIQQPNGDVFRSGPQISKPQTQQCPKCTHSSPGQRLSSLQVCEKQRRETPPYVGEGDSSSTDKQLSGYSRQMDVDASTLKVDFCS